MVVKDILFKLEIAKQVGQYLKKYLKLKLNKSIEWNVSILSCSFEYIFPSSYYDYFT